jgi:Asp-tRNA(Asn)/Glu-tRNA(Gln) amidotransferase A subunit family amidase
MDAKSRSGEHLLPAQCVPVVVKDNIDTAHLQTTGGSPLFAGWVPPTDATVTAKLQAAGASSWRRATSTTSPPPSTA